MPFSDFYLIFKLIFKCFSLLKSRKKGIYLPADADLASGPGGELTRGARDHCTGATRRWGDATMGGPREAQEAHRAWPRGMGPRVHAGPRGRPCGAPRGRWGRQMEGPRASGPWLGIRGSNALALNRPPI